MRPTHYCIWDRKLSSLFWYC